MPLALPREFKLATACSIWPPSERRIDAIRMAATTSLDWNLFLRVVLRHRVVGLVHDGLIRARPKVPTAITQEIAKRAAALVQQNLALAAESVRLQRLFAQADLPVVFFKGASLAMLAYGNVGLRQSQDIDLLVPYQCVPAAMELIARAGYHRFGPPSAISDGQLRGVMGLRKDFGFVHEATGLRLELHWRLFLNPHAMPEASMMASSQVVFLTGRAGLHTLDEEDLFAYLCMHGALHCWNRLQWLADINALLTAAGEGDVERLIHAAEARGSGRAAAQALLLCQRLLGTSLPVRLITTLAKNVTARWLEATALRAMTRGQGECDPHDARFGTTRGSLSTFLLSPSWRYRLSELNIHLMCEADFLAVPLPAQLRFLYPVLRLPLWMRRHSIRGRSPN
jgi:Uncharacterised nucleotidyltransferase